MYVSVSLYVVSVHMTAGVSLYMPGWERLCACVFILSVHTICVSECVNTYVHVLFVRRMG